MSRRSQTAVVLGLLLAALLVADPAASRQAKAVGKGKKTGESPLVMVAVGDSITAGFTDATLVEKAQRVSYPALIARQMEIPFGQPYVTGDGLPWLGFRFQRKERVLEIPVVPPLLGGPGRKDASNENVHNFAVPNAKTWEILSLSKKPGNEVDRLFQLILQGKGTQVEQARAKQPDLILLWTGNNDVLGIAGGAPDDGDGNHSYRLESRLTPIGDFRTAYRELIDRLAAPYPDGPRKGRKPDIVVANIPDLNDFPVLVPLGKRLGQVTDLPFEIRLNRATALLAGFPKNADSLTRKNLEALELSLTKPNGKGQHPPGTKVSLITVIDVHLNTPNSLFTDLANGKRSFTDAQVLSPDQLTRIHQHLHDLNDEIATICAASKIPVLDMHAIFKSAKEKGIRIGDTTLTTSYGGGLFSLDAIHPTEIATALIANEFIKVINRNIEQRRSFGGRRQPIPEIDLVKVLQAGKGK